MPHERLTWLSRIKTVEREHKAIRLAVDHLLQVIHETPGPFRKEVALRDFHNASAHLQGTFVLRLFAEFETGLRNYWTSHRNSDPPVRTLDLLNGVGAHRRIPHDHLQNAHRVREYRNYLLHQREESLPEIPIHVARGHLCRYFAFLPPQW